MLTLSRFPDLDRRRRRDELALAPSLVSQNSFHSQYYPELSVFHQTIVRSTALARHLHPIFCSLDDDWNHHWILSGQVVDFRRLEFEHEVRLHASR